MQVLIGRLVELARRAVAGAATVAIAEIALVAAIAVVAGLLTWRLLPPGAAPVDTSIPAAPEALPSSADTASIDLASLHLFGEAAPGDRAQPEAVPTEAPDTRLNLKLKGVFATGRGDGFAIITVGNGEQSVFAVGDRVAGKARVDGIYSDRVILDRNGALETLRLATENVPLQAARAATQRGAMGNRDLQRIAGKARELRSRLMQNPLQLARMVRFQPYLRDGELIGYRIQPRAADAQLLAELGLRPTDVITAVNGVSLNDPAQAQQVLQQMQSASVITVSWLRDGEQRQMTIPIGAPS